MKNNIIVAHFCFWNLLQLPSDGVNMKEVKNSHSYILSFHLCLILMALVIVDFDFKLGDW